MKTLSLAANSRSTGRTWCNAESVYSELLSMIIINTIINVAVSVSGRRLCVVSDMDNVVEPTSSQ